MLKELINVIVKRIVCKHSYEMVSNVSYREIETKNRYHEITVHCNKCGKTRDLVRFYTSNNSSLS